MGKRAEVGWRRGEGSELTAQGTLYHYLLTGQTDKWKNRHTDKQTARERSRTRGSLFYFTTGNVTDTIKMGGGVGVGSPCGCEGPGGEESTSSVRPEAAAGGGGRRSPQPIRPR